jgi:ABC-2 type transport system permease protein
MLLRIRMMIWKEFKQISRDPRMLAVVVALPIFMLIIYGYAINLDVRHLRVGIYDQDHSRESRDFAAAFTATDYFTPAGTFNNYKDVKSALDRGKVQVMLVIDRNFARYINNGNPANVQIFFDGSNSTSAAVGTSYAAQIVQEYWVKRAAEAAQRAGIVSNSGLSPIDLRIRYWYNPELRSVNFIIPGLIAVILMMLSALLTSVTVVREYERGTIELLATSPVRPFEIIIGKLVPYVLISFADVIVVLLMAYFVFHIPILGSLWLVFLASGLFLTAALGIGILISSISTSQQMAMTFAIIGTQLPTILLSGFIFPVSSMPPFIQLITNVIPAMHFIKVLRALFLKGIGFSYIWPQLLFLLILSVLLIVLSSKKVKLKL